MDSKQPLFDFSGSSSTLKTQEMKRAVLSWVDSQNADGMALNVPTRISRYKADIAAFWTKVHKRMRRPLRTMIIEIRRNREHCWPDVYKNERALKLLREEKVLKSKLEEQIKKQEPYLRESDNLFDDFESWNFLKSSNTAYHKSLRKIEKIEHSIYKGSRFEQIKKSHSANEYYLAVPENIIHPYDLAVGWGLLYIKNDMSVKIVSHSETHDCFEKNMNHLIQNICIQNKKDVLFANGIHKGKDGKVFVPVPHRRRKPGKR